MSDLIQEPPMQEQNSNPSQQANAQKDQFVINGDNNTIHIHNDASAVATLERIIDAQSLKHSQQTMVMKMAEGVIQSLTKAATDYIEKKGNAPSPSPAPPSPKKAPAKKKAVKKKAKAHKRK